jgi:RimJ/RimL family protein N-acetyltransferase
MEPVPDPWPLRHLTLRTPRLELRPDDDAGMLELVEQTYAGIHDPEWMPFSVPWTEAPREELGRNSLQFYWAQRAALKPDKWSINFLVRLDGKVIGTQGMQASDFAVRREVDTGSWLGRAFQGRGFGTEMRAAVLQLAFDHLGADTARSGAWSDNAPSHGVSRKLGYRQDGTETLVRRGGRDVMQRLLLSKEWFAEHRPQWMITVDGLTDECRRMLGA